MTDLPKVNPLLEKLRIVQGETIKLPSCGLLYEEGVLDPNVTDGEIRLHPMTIRDEIVMRSPDALFSGEAIKTILSRCAPQILEPLRLHYTDLDFVMLALRKVSYGPELEVSYDHDCEGHKEHSYVVNVDQKLRECIHLDPIQTEEQYKLHLQATDQIVEFKPLAVDDMIRILQPNNNDFTDAELEAEMIRLATTQICSVDGDTDRANILEWASMIPASAMRAIRLKLEEMQTWGINYKFKIVCRDCGQPVEAEVPLNAISFFT